MSTYNADFNPANSDTQPLPPAGAHVAFDPQYCRACRVCEVMCSIAHEGVAQPALARIHILFDEFREENPISASICFQCTSAAEDAAAEAPCMEACPKGAMSRDERTGAVLIDEARCIGCMLCQKACPWDVPVCVSAHTRRLAVKCDLCAGRAEGPICVQMCPLSGKALRYQVAVTQGAPRVGVLT